MYILHFVSEELIYSEQQKVNQHYSGTYDQIAVSVLSKYLKVPNKKIGIVEKTRGIHDSIVPLLTPFETVQWLSKRETTLLISPISGKRYIKSDDNQLFIIIESHQMTIVNHQYSYNIDIAGKSFEKISQVFDAELYCETA